MEQLVVPYMHAKRGQNMLLGIDVGGTFTDAVIVEHGQVVSWAKKPTTQGQLLTGILAVIDQVLLDHDSVAIERVALSTTVVTNALVEGKTDRVGLCIMPGPGLDISGVLPGEPYILSGYVDHRGREVSAPDRETVAAACRQFTGCEAFAVSGKFAVRNPRVEQEVSAWISQYAQPSHITLGSEIAGSLNFLRRTNSAYYNAAVWRHFGDFATAVETAVKQRGINAPVYVLKADGGTMPLAIARRQPVEAIFTGPAASVLGIMAIIKTGDAAVSLDIGGTTTDIALWRRGVPLFAERGARVGGYPTAVRAFWLTSVGLGGDSYVCREGGGLKVGPSRRGAAMAVGGPEPTVADAMLVAGLANFGDQEKALQAMRQVAAPGQSPQETADEVLAVAAEIIVQSIENMLDEQAAEPVYRVEDIVHSTRFEPQVIIGVGGAAVLAPLVAQRFGIPCQIPDGAMVANALGAAVARPTIDITLRADTAQGYYTVAELGLKRELPNRRFDLAAARDLAARHLAERAIQVGISVLDIEIVQEEEFNLVRGFQTTGKIITCRLQIKPGVLVEDLTTDRGGNML
jgi:N-methylhydantoinase A/oxoprolinase/acetone carboxylase beta subunit